MRKKGQVGPLLLVSTALDNSQCTKTDNVKHEMKSREKVESLPGPGVAPPVTPKAGEVVATGGATGVSPVCK